jgi:hypothetical protein
MSENQQPTDQEIHKALFAHLVMMLATSASQQMGKLMNRETGKTEMNLDAAQAMIDLLDMLQSKTRGNLDRDEERMLGDTLTSLKLTFVETRDAQPAGSPPSPAGPPPEADQKSAGDAEKEPKFRKKY